MLLEEEQNEAQPSDEEINAVVEREAKKVMAESMGAVLDDIDAKDFEPAPDDEPPKEPSQTDTPQEEESDKAAAPSLKEQLAAMTLNYQKLQKALDSTNGRYGSELQQLRARIDELNQSSNLKKTIAKLSIDHPAFENIKKDYPDIGQDLINGFRLALTGDEETETSQETPEPPLEQTQNPPEPAAPQDHPTTKQLALESLKDKHKDFAEVAGFDAREIAPGFNQIEWKNPAFGQWLETMPENVREVVIKGGNEPDPSSDTILFIRDVLTEFKNQQAAKPKEAVTPKPTPIKHKPDLSRSLVPTGRSQNGKVALSPDEIIENAKRETMKQYMAGY